LELQELELQEMQKKNRPNEPEPGHGELERDSYKRAIEDRKAILIAELEEDRRRQESLGNERIKSAEKQFAGEGSNVGPSVNHNYAYMPRGGHRNYGEPGPLNDANDKSFAKEFERSVPRDKYGNSSNYYKEIEKYHNHTPLTQMNVGGQTNNIRGINNIYNKMDYKNTTGNPHESNPGPNFDNQPTNFGGQHQESRDIAIGDPRPENRNLDGPRLRSPVVEPRLGSGGNGSGVRSPNESLGSDKNRLAAGKRLPPNYKSKVPGTQTVG
jgi:hypothetical protein